MAELRVQVVLDRSAFDKGIASLDTLIKKYENQKLTIKVDTEAIGKLSKSMLDVANNQAKAAEAQEKTAQSANRLATAQTNAGQSTEKTLGALKASIVQLFSLQRAVQAVKSAFQEALGTMREVDSELTTIRKVTGMTAAEMDAMGQSAYKVASQYGVAASEYLKGVESFARAGYGEQSAALGELAVKTQLVGDTTSEVANQFLLAVDASYGYQGSVAELSRVLDGANAIDNNYATSIEKIAEGMGKIAPIAAQAHVSVEELTAAIGTITAVTQRSGSEASTALRALFLNIMGDTKTEIEDGATWTAGEIEGLRDVLNIYAADVVKAADATGTLINPMEAIGALAKSYKDGILTEQTLMQMVTDIGGKLRSSQLLALIQHWDMYASMLDTVAESAGSADAEVSMMLTSWEAKANVLSNTWTQFIAKTVDTDWIKGLLDGVTWLLKSFDSLEGMLPTLASALLTAFGPKILASVKGLWAAVKNLAVSFAEMASQEGIGAAFKSLVSGAHMAQVVLAALTLVIAGATAAYNNYVNAQRDAQEAAKKNAETQLGAAETSANDAQNVVTLAEAYRQAAAGSGDLEGASSALKTALEKEGGAVGDLAGQYKELTEEKLKAAKYDADLAVNQARAAMEAIYWPDMDIDLGSFTNDGMGDFYREMNAFGIDPMAFSYTPTLGGGSVSPMSKDTEGVLAFYDAMSKYKSIVEEISVAYAENGDSASAASVLQGEYYQKISAATTALEPYISGLREAEQTQDRANAAYAVWKEEIDDQGEYDDFIANMQAANSLSDDQAATWAAVAAQIFQQYAQGAKDAADAVGDSADAQEQSAAKTDQWAEGVRKSIGILSALRKAQEEGTEQTLNGVKYLDLTEEQFKALAESGAKLTDTDGELVDGVTELTDGYRLHEDVLKDLEETEKTFLEQQGVIPKKVKATAEEILALADAALTLSDDLYRAAEALETYNSAVEGGEKGDVLTAMAKAYESAMAMYEKGMVGSTQFQAAADMLLGTDVMASLGYDYQRAGELMGTEFFQAFLASGGDNFGEAALEYLADSWGDVRGASGEVIASFHEVDGAIQWAVGDVNALADALHVAPAVVEALIDAWSVFNGEIPATRDEIEQLLSAMDVIRDGMQVDLQSFVDGLKETGKTEADITKLASAMQSLGYEFEGLDGDSLAEGIRKAMQQAAESGEDENTIVIAYDDSEVKTGVALTKSLLDGLPESKTITITYVTKGANILAHAEGTKDAPGGPTLVNEEGPELISDRGQAYIAGGGNPAIVNLSPHAIVLDAGDTKKALRGVSLTGVIGAAASGISAYAALKNTEVGRSFSGSVPVSGAAPKKNTGGGGGGGAKADATDWWAILTGQVNYARDVAQDAIDDVEYRVGQLQDAMDDLTEPYEEQIDALERQNDLLDRQAELLERERDKAVEPLQKQIDALQEAKDIEDDQLKLEEAKKAVLSAQAALQNAQNERTIRFYNKEKQQWEWMADQKKVQEAQDALADAEKKLSDVEYDLQIKALERERDAIRADYDAQLEAIRDQQTAIDDQIYELNQVIQRIEDAYKELMRPLEKQAEEMKRTLEEVTRAWENISTVHDKGDVDLRDVLTGLAGDAQIGKISSLLSALKAYYPDAFDQGGVAVGKGFLRKATDAPEGVLPPDVMQAILAPRANANFERVAQGLGLMFGATKYSGKLTPRLAGAGGVTNNNTGDTYYISGIKLGSDQADLPLSRLVKTIPLYTGGV